MKSLFLVSFAYWWFLLPLAGQFSDDFNDGDLVGWEGDAGHFTVNAGLQLQLNAPAGSTSSWLYTPVAYSDSMIWEIYLRLDFAPSTSNQLRLYLGVTSPDLATASGYLLEIGATGDQDRLELKYLGQGSIAPVAGSAPGLVAAEPVAITLRIIHRINGEWAVYDIGQAQPALLFTATHNALAVRDLTHFGMHCRYTETRRDKFFFDDIRIHPIVPDTKPPLCLSAEATGPETVRLVFDEPLDEATVLTPSHYTLTPGNLHPVEIQYTAPAAGLRFSQPFISQQEYTLAIGGIRDAAGNTMLSDVKTFSYTHISQALPDDILITEIMADPTPVNGLPDAEYVEIYNASQHSFRLSDYIFQAGTTERSLPDILLHGGEFIVLCATVMAPQFETSGRVAGIGTMPALTNTGATVLIKNTGGEIIHAVSYSSQWYGDPLKSDGGWSLEMINPRHLCSAGENWRASISLTGGTPGQINSLWTTEPDEEGPALVSLFTASDEMIVLRFSEKIDVVLMENPAIYSTQPGLGIAGVTVADAFTVELVFSTPMQDGVVYTLQPFEAYDCLGNVGLITPDAPFGLLAAPEPGDILIHEILFNPATGGSRFIEVINASRKFIDLSALVIGRFTATQQQVFPVMTAGILAPGGIAAFTPEPQDILSRYTVPHPEKLYMSSLPSWNDKTDHAAILSGGVFIDSFTYSSSWHHPVIADQNGVSLERVSIQAPTASASTWHSAAGISGYATPTGPNSQQAHPGPAAETPFTIENKRFSPDGDGLRDFLALHFQFVEGDYTGSVWIYDLEGREIYRPVDNESLGASSIIQWDGRTAEGRPAEMGIYIIFVRLWKADGEVREYKETCALVRRG